MKSSAAASTTNDKTAVGFASLQLVTAACHGIMNTQFIPPATKPKWFDGLAKDLDRAKVLAKQWIDDIAPQMSASIPTHVIDYGTTYNALTEQIISLVDKNPNARGKDDPVVKQIFALILELEKELGSTIVEVDTTSEQLKKWGNDMQGVHDALYRGAANIQSTMTDLAADVEKMDMLMKGLRQQISTEQTVIGLGAAAIGVGIFIAIIGFAITALTAGAAAVVGGVVMGFGVAMAIGGGVTWGVMQDKINKQMDEIAQHQKQLDDDKRQIVSLKALAMSADTALSATATATKALSDVKVMWQTFRGELQGTLNKLEKTDETVSSIVNKAWVIAAQKEWELAVQFAQQLVGMKVGVAHQNLKLVA